MKIKAVITVPHVCVRVCVSFKHKTQSALGKRTKSFGLQNTDIYAYTRTHTYTHTDVETKTFVQSSFKNL